MAFTATDPASDCTKTLPLPLAFTAGKVLLLLALFRVILPAEACSTTLPLAEVTTPPWLLWLSCVPTIPFCATWFTDTATWLMVSL